MAWDDDPVVAEPVSAVAVSAPAWLNDPIIAETGKQNVATGPLEALRAGYQGSATGLALRGRLPDIVLDSHNSTWYEKAIASIGQMGSELPAMIGGAIGGGVAGTAAGAAVTGPAAPVGGIVGGILGAGAGAFAVPALIRQSLIESYKSGTVDSSGGFLNSVGIVLKTTAKEGVVGAATFGAGGVAARVVGKAIAPAIGEAITVGTGRAVIGTAATAAEIGTMVVTPAALDGHLPEWSDFVNAAVVVGFAKGAVHMAAPAVRATANKLGDIYAKTGIRPEQVVADAQRVPEVALDLKPVEAHATHEPMVTVFHGSPHEFSAFDASKIGTGEGAQAYGHGLYFAENPKVSSSYVGGREFNILKADGTPVDGTNSPYKTYGFLAQAQGDLALAAKNAREMGTKPDVEAAAYLEELAQSGAKTDIGGNHYKVQIPQRVADTMLDWDKPMSEQAPSVQAALKKLGVKDTYFSPGSPTLPREALGKHLYEQIAAGRQTGIRSVGGFGVDGEAASKVLSDAGVTGIKYLDQGSRDAGTGTRNYVLFDAQHARVVERNGKTVNGPTDPLQVVAKAGDPLSDPKIAILSDAMRDIDALAARYKNDIAFRQYFKDGDFDRGTARIVDAHGKELKQSTQDLIYSRYAKDWETGESIPGHDSVRGTHIFDLREEIAQRQFTLDESSAEIPRAYRQAADAETVANAMPDPVKVQEVVSNLSGEITAGKVPNHINYRYVNEPADIQAIHARISEVFTAEIASARGAPKGWEATATEARDALAASLGVSPRAIERGSLSLDAEIMAKNAMTQRAAYDVAEAARVVREAAGNATEVQVRELQGAVETLSAIQAQFLGNAAELGRALNAMKAAKQTGALAADIKALRDRFGEDPQTLAKVIGELGTVDAISKFARTATVWEKVVEGWKAGILSGPVTHMANIIGNSTFMAMRPVIDLTAAAIGKVTGAQERVVAAEPFARIFGDLQGAKDALKLAGSAMRLAYEEGGVKGIIKEAAIGKDGEATKAEVFRKAIEGTKGDIIRLPFRALQLADAFFKMVNERGEAYALATRQAVSEGFNISTREFRERVVDLVQNDIAINAAASEAGLRFTFNLPLGEAGQSVSNVVRKMHLEMLVPFIRTPGNILKELARMSPLAPLVGEWRAAIGRGGADQAKAMAELGMGTAIMGVVASYALDGSITGQGSPDAGKKRVAAAAGQQPYSIKIGDTYYNYQRLQPLGTLIGMAADMAEMWDMMTAEEVDKLPKMVSVAFANAVTNQTFLQGITNIVNAMSDPKRFGPRLAQSMAASTVPAIIGQPTTMSDPYVREINSMLDAIRARIPGQREELMAKRDVFGEKIQTKTRLGGISPVTETTESTDLVRTEALRLGVSASEAPKKIHLGRNTGKIGDVEITPEQRNKYTEISGQTAHQILDPIVNSAKWNTLPDLIQKRIYQRAFEVAHKKATLQTFTLEERRTLIETINGKMRDALERPEVYPKSEPRSSLSDESRKLAEAESKLTSLMAEAKIDKAARESVEASIAEERKARLAEAARTNALLAELSKHGKKGWNLIIERDGADNMRNVRVVPEDAA